ncbi:MULTISPECIES: alcohol dehydrogenase [Pectobacterium]|uniref:Alcohol dehydrogenase n=1 Tax=Pectobacterium punjabense TaxID=2108399 RepID=A0ABX6KXI3_9GAMM|nr:MULTISPECIES: alcohol dehydrogenase [Pectobacterium]GKW11165.1 NADH-dependent alcohol dehydrogenase [Pectobacterium carotovorum subsp. carotovorum]MBN3135742.1 alcohol dehydrogenase [Pectobacterium punjabense]MBS4432721.1 alcohol dehydrogenase [Pectobacterium punjabense]MBT9183832.1 alcohol dehydrogenase [Pectobacterium punjabense]MCE5380312.1 alcohol dehydrogenase [Pectobacterium punjabense]
MLNFTLHTPTKILFGEGQIAELGKEIPADARILITYGGGSVKHNGVLDQVYRALEGRNVREFSGIEPNPTYETLMKAVEVVRAEKIDFLLAVGGGSVVDGTKFIAAAADYQAAQDPWHILQTGGAEIDRGIAMAAVLTLPATGSESNNGAVITRKSTNDKLAFRSRYTQPLFAVLDPVVTYTLPARQIANGVVDAFVHTVEQYLTYSVDAKVQDRFAEGLLLTLVEEGPRALAEPENYKVRANVMWSATMALNGLIGAGVPQDWSTHMLGHELTALHGLDHAQTLAIVLPAMLTARRAQKRDKLLQYAERVWNLRDGSEDQRIDGAIAATRDFFETMGVPTRFSDYQLDGSSIPTLVAKLNEHGLTALGEHRDITLEESQKIYEAAR